MLSGGVVRLKHVCKDVVGWVEHDPDGRRRRRDYVLCSVVAALNWEWLGNVIVAGR